MTDFEDLLKRYMEQVDSMEGTEHLPDLPDDINPAKGDFTREEVLLLWSLSSKPWYREKASLLRGLSHD